MSCLPCWVNFKKGMPSISVGEGPFTLGSDATSPEQKKSWMQLKAYKFRLWTNANQERELGIALETHRRLYNDALAQRQWFYDQWQISRSYCDQSGWYKEERLKNPYFARINFSSAQGTLRRLDKAFGNFFRRVKNGEKPGYPRFKSRERFDSILYPSHGDGIRLSGNRLRVQHAGTIRVCLHREVEGKIKTLCLKREGGKWFVVVTCELPDRSKIENTLPPIGLDVGLTHFVTTSDGERIANPRFLKAELPALRSAQRALSRKKKGGSNRRKARLQLSRLHARVANLRHEHRHKVSNHLLSRSGWIAVERLNVRGMLKNRRLARAISDVAWSSFVEVLTRKAERAGGEVRQVSPNYSSQFCSRCGENVPKSLAVRLHRCSCGLVLDRDQNAALNILERAWPGTGQWGVTLPLGEVLQEAVSLLADRVFTNASLGEAADMT
jgi:putative transposase